MKKLSLLFTAGILLGAILSSAGFAQKLPIGSKGFENISRSIFLKEGGYGNHFPQFYKQLASSFKGYELNRAEIRELARLYIHSNLSASNAYKLLQSKTITPPALNLPSDVPFIAADNVKAVASAVWKRDNLGTERELFKLQKTLVSNLSKFPNKQLTLKEFYYVVSKYTFEGPNFIKGFLENLPDRPLLTRVELSGKGKEPLTVFVYPDQAAKVVELYYTGKPFKIEKGKVIEL